MYWPSWVLAVAVSETIIMYFQCDLAEPCDLRVRCINLNPGFRCDPCPPGYTGSAGVEGIGLEEAYHNRQQCYDIDECNDGRNGGCAPNSICVNVEVCRVQYVTDWVLYFWCIQVLTLLTCLFSALPSKGLICVFWVEEPTGLIF